MMKRLAYALLWLALAEHPVYAQDATAAASLFSTSCPGTGCVVLGTPGRGGGAIQVLGTWSGTLQFEASVDAITWFAMPVSTVATTPAFVTSATANGRWNFGPAGYAAVRVRVSAYTSGTVNVALRASTSSLARVTISSGGGSGTPGGADTDVQFNDSGAFGGSSRLTWDNSLEKLTVLSTAVAGTTAMALSRFSTAESPQGLQVNAEYDGSGSGGAIIGLETSVGTDGSAGAGSALSMISLNVSSGYVIDSPVGTNIGINVEDQDGIGAANYAIKTGTGTVDLGGPLIASSLAYPTADGTPNQVMFTDGAGVLGFADISTLDPEPSDTDDNNVAAGQAAELAIGLTYVYDGAVWRRLAFGQAVMASSVPVVLASNQSAIPVSQSGTWTVQPGNTANSTAWLVTGTGGTFPITAAALPLPTLAATSTKQSDGTQKTQLVDGAGNVIGATANALDINIKSGNPTTITATQATGTNLHTVVDSGTLTAVTAITNALPAGSNVIGHVIADTGSTTAVTGNVTVVQATATNLKAQAEAYQGGTAVGAANPLQVTLANTGINTNAVKVSQATGTNLHTVVDSGTILVTGLSDTPTTGTGTLSFLNDQFDFVLSGKHGALLSVLASSDGSNALSVYAVSTSWTNPILMTLYSVTSNGTATQITAGTYQVYPPPGADSLRVICNNYGSGTMSIALASSGTNAITPSIVYGIVNTQEVSRGQTTMSASIPVTLASNQSGLAVTNAGLTSLSATVASPGSRTLPTSLQVIAGITEEPVPTVQPLPLAPGGTAVLTYSSAILPLPRAPCNAVRRTNCQPKGY